MTTITTSNGSKIEMSKSVEEIYNNGGFMSFYDDNDSKELIIDGYGYSSKSTTFRGRVDLDNKTFRANTNIHKFVY